MKEQLSNILLQANYNKGFSDGLLTAYQLMNQENAEETGRTQESWFGEDQEDEVTEE